MSLEEKAEAEAEGADVQYGGWVGGDRYRFQKRSQPSV